MRFLNGYSRTGITFSYSLPTSTVPAGNNSSKRTITEYQGETEGPPAGRAGRFKADSAAMAFAKIRSVIDTTIKNSQNVMAALRLIARNEFVLEA